MWGWIAAAYSAVGVGVGLAVGLEAEVRKYKPADVRSAVIWLGLLWPIFIVMLLTMVLIKKADE